MSLRLVSLWCAMASCSGWSLPEVDPATLASELAVGRVEALEAGTVLRKVKGREGAFNGLRVAAVPDEASPLDRWALEEGDVVLAVGETLLIAPEDVAMAVSGLWTDVDETPVLTVRRERKMIRLEADPAR